MTDSNFGVEELMKILLWIVLAVIVFYGASLLLKNLFAGS